MNFDTKAGGAFKPSRSLPIRPMERTCMRDRSNIFSASRNAGWTPMATAIHPTESRLAARCGKRGADGILARLACAGPPLKSTVLYNRGELGRCLAVRKRGAVFGRYELHRLLIPH